MVVTAERPKLPSNTAQSFGSWKITGRSSRSCTIVSIRERLSTRGELREYAYLRILCCEWGLWNISGTFHVFHDPRITHRAHSHDVHRVVGHRALPTRGTLHASRVSYDRTHNLKQPGVEFWRHEGDRKKVPPSESPVSRGSLRACNRKRSTSLGISSFHTISGVNAKNAH